MAIENLGQRIRWVRKSNFLSMVAFAEKVGCDQSYISRLEKGKALNPSPDLLRRICKEFDVTEGWLFLGEGEPSQGLIGRKQSQVNDFPALRTLTRKQLDQAIAHFQREALKQPTPLKSIYLEIIGRLILELTTRMRETAEEKGDA